MRLLAIAAFLAALSPRPVDGSAPTAAVMNCMAAGPDAGTPALLPYKSVAGRTLFLHVFAPDSTRYAGPRPAIIYFHGGGWTEGDATRFHDQARHLAGKGMVAISAEYRLKSIDQTDPSAALADAISAMRHVRAHARELQIDPQRIAAGGGSAGGQLAAALATTTAFSDPGDDPSQSHRPSALVLFNPVVDNGPGGFGHDRVASYWQRFSPIHNIRPGHPPTVILLGTRDELVPVTTGEAYCDRVRAAGSSCQLHLYEGQPHAFFAWRRSPQHYCQTLVATDEFLAGLGYLEPES